jgi:hypothetical protein
LEKALSDTVAPAKEPMRGTRPSPAPFQGEPDDGDVPF